MLKLVPFCELAGSDLAKVLHGCVKSNVDNIRQDFPRVVERYGTLDAANASVQQVLERPGKDLVPFAILYEGKVIGAATLWKSALWPTGIVGLIAKLLRRPIVDGAQLAFWLAHRESRNGAPDNIAELVVDSLVVSCAGPQLWKGAIWSLVRPDHPRANTVLLGAGFIVTHELPDARHVDGVPGRRKVYVKSGH